MCILHFINCYRKLSYIPLLLIIATSTIMCSCKKSSSRESNISKPPIISKVDSSKIKDSIRIADSTRIADSLAAIAHKTIKVGTGSGDLTIDGNNFIVNGIKRVLTNGDIIKIKGGSYSSITIKNVSVPADGERVIFMNDGLIQFDGNKHLYLSDLNNVTVSGAGNSGNERGFAFTNSSYRAVALEGSLNNFTLQNMLFKNVDDYVISYVSGSKNRVYNGSPESYSANLAFLNLDADNVGPLIWIEGEINASNFTGLIKGIEIAGITCINSPDISTVVFLGSSEGYNIHDNFVSNVNMQNNNHNSIFMLRGSGKFYNNTVKNHQGNAVRAWIYSLDKEATVEIFNNKIYNSRKYSAFELQVTQGMRQSSVFKPANAKVYNNTVGKMNTERASFPGRVLDLYNTWGTLEIYNNLYFENNDALLINNNSDVTITKNQNNTYKAIYTDAVSNLNNFTSKISGIGAP